jgi:CPA2 family monovalent cation:H+ antiporter-2
LESSLMIWLGFVSGRLFGWSKLESLFAGSIIANSSTTIVAKAFAEQGVRGPLRELVVGILRSGGARIRLRRPSWRCSSARP